MLILLDNAATAEQIRPLLPGTPSSAVVVTSRDSLPGLVAVDGAHRIDTELPCLIAIATRQLVLRLAAEIGPGATDVSTGGLTGPGRGYHRS